MENKELTIITIKNHEITIKKADCLIKQPAGTTKYTNSEVTIVI